MLLIIRDVFNDRLYMRARDTKIYHLQPASSLQKNIFESLTFNKKRIIAFIECGR